MTFETALLTAVAAEAAAITGLFAYIKIQHSRASAREDKIHDQYCTERRATAERMATDRREFTRVLYKLANISDTGEKNAGTETSSDH